MKGYYNRVAWIDLSRKTTEIKPFEPGDRESFIGGANLGAAMLARLVDGGTDPLSPANPLIVMTGPFTASAVPAGSRHAVVSVSPQTGMFCNSIAGGSFGRQLVGAGLDGLVITGAADGPVQIVIDGNDIAVRDAASLWGKDTYETDDALKETYGKKIAAAVIGPAGENLVPLANIAHDGRHTRFAGRGGLGAVMGSKKLKAIVIMDGKQERELYDAAGLKAAVMDRLPFMREKLEFFAKYGTPGSISGIERTGNLPIDNWRQARAVDIAENINGVKMAETIQVKRSGCKRCPILCSRVVEVKEGPFKTDGVVEAPEYETIGGFGSLQNNGDLASIARMNELCNRFGMDTISVSGTIAMANECWEKGLLKASDTDGLELGWTKPEVYIELIRRMAYAEGDFGALMSKGSRAAAKEIGGNAEEFAIHVKGLELGMHDPRFSWGQAIGYATGSRGGCHMSTVAHLFENHTLLEEMGYNEPLPGRQYDGKAKQAVTLQNVMTIRDSLVACNFVQLFNSATWTVLTDWYNMITGAGLAPQELIGLGEKGFTLHRIINNRFGITRKDDQLPIRLRTVRKIGEDINFDVPPMDPLLADYYEVRGWTMDGRPSADTIERVGLNAFIA